MNAGRGEEGLAVLIERSAELKRDLRRRKARYHQREHRPGVSVTPACSSWPPAVVRKGANAHWQQPPGEIMTGHGVVRR